MSQVRHVRELILLILFLVASFGVGIISYISSDQQARNTTSAQAATNIDQYCRGGIYYVKDPNDTTKEISCGRGVCGGVSYEGTAGINHVSAGKCWVGSSECGPACRGLVPLCCYKMAETGNAEDCPFPERGFCMKQQCEKQTQDSNCGSQQGAYCVDECVAHRSEIPYISLEDRLAGRTTPSGGNQTPPTNTPRPPTAVPPTSVPPTNRPPTQRPTQPPQRQNTPTSVQTQPTPTTVAQNPPVTQTITTLTPTQTVRQPSPTRSETYVFDLPDNDITNTPGDNQQNQQQQNTTSPISQNTATDNTNVPLAFSLPQIEIKTPKQALRETLDRPTIEKINQATEKPLALAKTSFTTIKTYDQQLENTVENWLFRIRITIAQWFQ